MPHTFNKGDLVTYLDMDIDPCTDQPLHKKDLGIVVTEKLGDDLPVGVDWKLAFIQVQWLRINECAPMLEKELKKASNV